MDNHEKPGFRLPRRLIIKHSNEIRDVLHDGFKKTGKYINVFMLPADERRFAVIVPKRIGNAVKRNRMKRLCREVYRCHPDWFPDSRTIFFVKRFHDVYADLVEDVEQLVDHP